jgi:hypothetical protein
VPRLRLRDAKSIADMLISFPSKLDFGALKEATSKHLNGLIVAHATNGVKAHFVN